MKIRNSEDFEQKLDKVRLAQDALRDYALKVLYATEFTAKQIQEMESAFWKWMNEGTGHDYFPEFDFFGPELEYLLELCIGDSNQLESWFDMIEYE